MSSKLKVSCVQFCPVFGDTDGNIKKISELTLKAESDLVVFPELITSGYNFKDRAECFELSINVSKSQEMDSLTESAINTYTYLVIGLPERHDEKVYNSSVLISPKGKINIYRKIHLFDQEKNVFDPGNRAPEVIETDIGKIGMMICFDWIFPEICRSLAIGGAQIICHPSNLVLSYCQKAMFARSVENSVFTMTSNRIGSENRNDRNLKFTGYSQILSPKGEVLSQAGEFEEEIISAEILATDADDKNITILNHLIEDRRPEFYGRLQNKL